MQQIEVISWSTLDALKSAATKVVKVIGDLDTNEQMAVFCYIEEDYLELYYSEADSNYIRHFEDENEFYEHINLRKKEFGEEEYSTMEYFEDEEDGDDENSGDDFSGFNIREDDDEDDY